MVMSLFNLNAKTYSNVSEISNEISILSLEDVNNKNSLPFQERTIKGKVTDVDGSPLPGVNVLIVGTSIGASTDFDGNYTISAKEGDVLEFSFVGMTKIKRKVGSSDTLDVILEENANSLDEVVVTALGIARSKKSLAYSVTEVDGGDFTEARETNIANSLSGKVAGVNVSNLASGPAGSTRVIIRGNTSLTGNNQPLYVIDGVPMDNSNQGSAGMWGGSDKGDGIGNINPDDIESMTVLKGNTAAALYGFRAANGVIQIITKGGKSTEGLQVELNSNFVFDEAANYLDVQKVYGLGEKGKKPADQTEALAFGQSTWGALLDGSNVVQFDGVSRPYAYAGDNFDRFYETGTTFTNTLSFSGGSDKIGFRFAVSDLGNSSIIPNSGMHRNNISFNVHGKVGEKLSISATGQYIAQQVHNISSIADSPGNANYPVWNLPNTINVRDLQGDPDKLGADPVTGQEYLASSSVWFQNPYWAAYQYQINTERNRFIGSFNMTYNITDWLYIQGRGGLDQYDNIHDAVTPYGTSYNVNGSLSQDHITNYETNFDVMLGSRQNFDSGFGYDLMVGANRMRQEYRSVSASGNTYALPFFDSYSNTKNRGGGIGYSALGTNSVYGQAEFSYNSFLYLTLTSRTDWFSSLNGQNITYPSVSLSGVLSDIVNMPDFISYLKVRGAWAQVGGATGAYQLNQSYGLNEPHLGQAVGGIAQGSVLNAELSPLTVTELEFGIDASFFNNRLGMDFTIYDRTTTDDILNASISQTSGYTGAVVNVGELTNKGVELLLHGDVMRKDNFKWNASFNMGYNKSEVVSLLDPENPNETLGVSQSRMLTAFVQHIEGKPYGQIAGWKFLRDDSGNIVVDDQGLPRQDLEQGVSAFGSGVHPFTWGLTNTFRYKDFSFSFLVDGKNGGKIAVGTNQQLYMRGLHEDTVIGRDTGIGSIPASNVSDYYNHIANNITEPFVQDASFIKLRQLTLDYHIPSSIIEKIGGSAATVSLVGRNLWLISSHVDNIDPESTYEIGNGQGLEFLSVPQTRSYGFNINIKF